LGGVVVTANPQAAQWAISKGWLVTKSRAEKRVRKAPGGWMQPVCAGAAVSFGKSIRRAGKGATLSVLFVSGVVPGVCHAGLNGAGPYRSIARSVTWASFSS